jgi:hypothetical protein
MGIEITVEAKVKLINPSREISCINLELKSDYPEDGSSRFLQNVGNIYPTGEHNISEDSNIFNLSCTGKIYINPTLHKTQIKLFSHIKLN